MSISKLLEASDDHRDQAKCTILLRRRLQTLELPQEPAPGTPPEHIVNAECKSVAVLQRKEGEKWSAAAGIAIDDQTISPASPEDPATQTKITPLGM